MTGELTAEAAAEPYPVDEDSLDIAVIGMACRFPGAATVEEFWHNLRTGVCSVTFFDEAELAAAGADPQLLADPRFVPAAAPLAGHDLFDADFFGYSPREAQTMDPQHRVLLECAWEALERAGYDPARYDGLIGAYAAGGAPGYLIFNLISHPELIETVGAKQVQIGNSTDFLATRLSYKLGLEGPSVSVQSACSSSLVAIAQAAQALLGYQCDIALAGGVSVDVVNRYGYRYEEDGLLSPDGYCRAFDAEARGTVGGSGAGMVVLKRLADAVRDGDHIHAVIKGSAVNNDGSRRAGFTAPREDGQALAITTALANAGVEPETVGYVEGHGTATILGDPIEVAALTAAFATGTSGRGYCALGSVKTNIGHLDAAAGVAGFIKTVLSVEHGEIPPTLHFRAPNPRIDFARSPFFVNTRLLPWSDTGSPRRAGVSSFGLGGTNAHVVLEEAPPRPPGVAVDAEQLLVLSAGTDGALEEATGRLARYLHGHRGAALADVAYTLQVGRKHLSHRRALVCRDAEDARTALELRDETRLLSAAPPGTTRRVAFLFTGFGDQYPGMARGLYEQEPVFRAALDRCAAQLAPHLDRDLRDVLFDGAAAARTVAPDPTAPALVPDLRRMLAQPRPDDHPLDLPRYGYPALFALEYALVELWRSWGVEPAAMIGHSLGEYVAACVAGVFSLTDALWLVVQRARLIEEQPEGRMVAVPLPEDEVRRYLGDDVALAAVNTPRTCVLSGTPAAIETVVADLERAGVACRRLATRSAFHSHLMDPVVDRYAALVRQVTLNPPRIRFASNVSGTWITAEEATDPGYWARHLRATVRFADGVAALWGLPGAVLLEVGPGQTLSSTALQHPAAGQAADRVALSSVRPVHSGQSDRAFLLRTVGQLWLAGVPLHWPALHGTGHRRRVPLPTYPFQRQRYWLEPRPDGAARPAAGGRRHDPSTWFCVPSWHRMPASPADADLTAGRWLVFVDDAGVGQRLVQRLRAAGAAVVTVAAGDGWQRSGPETFVLDPGQPEHYHRLAAALREGVEFPDRLVHCWSLGGTDGPEGVAPLLARCYASLLHWAQATEPELMTLPQRWDVVSDGVFAVTGDERLYPAKAAVQGICKVAPQEYPGLRCRHVDVVLPEAHARQELADRLLAELTAADDEAVLALRGSYRWRPAFEPVQLPAQPAKLLRDGGVYLITGGLGRIGLVVARSLARLVRAKLVLVGRTGLPERAAWTDGGCPPEARPAVRAVQEMEALGAEVLVCPADVADGAALRAAIGQAVARFGPINGVLHSAGSVGPGAHRTLAETQERDSERHFGPKLHGVRALRDALDGQEPDFVLLFSSIAAVLGGLGFGAYAAANAHLDAFAHAQRQRGAPWTSVGWEAWSFPEPQEATSVIGAAVRDLAIDPDEGRTVFERLMTAELPPQILVSTGDLAARARQWADPVRAAEVAIQRHARPHLRNAYVAPGDELEEQIAGIWQELLGVDQVGVHDNFFELGGSSLLGLQVVHQLRRALRLAVPLTVVYEGPTVRTLAQLVRESRAGFGTGAPAADSAPAADNAPAGEAAG